MPKLYRGGVSNNLSILNNHKDIQKLKTIAEATGNPVLLKDSAEELLKSLEIKGSTTQVQTTGKNLFDIEGWFKQCEVVYRKENNKFYYSANGKLFDAPFVISEEDEEHTISFKVLSNESSTNARIEILNKNGKVVKSLNASDKPQYITAIFSRVRFNWTTGKTMMVDSIQVEKGSIATEYEPYSGGFPSPSPEYPQEVVNGVVDGFGCTRKNLFDIKDIEPGKPAQIVKCNIQHPIVINWVNDGVKLNSPVWRIRLTYKDGTTKYVRDNDAGYDNVPRFTDDVTSQNPIIEIFARSEEMVSGAYRDIQIEFAKERKPTSYEPYKGFSESIESITLSEWDAVKKIDGIWCKESFGFPRMFDGSDDEIWGKQDSAGKNAYRIYVKGLQNFNKNTRIPFVYANNFKGVAYGDKWEYNNICIADNSKIIVLYDVATLEEFRAFLKENPIKAVYKTEKPTIEPLSQAIQDVLNRLQTFYPNSVIQTNEGITLNLQYVADNKLYNDRTNQILLDRIEQIEQAILQNVKE